MNSKLSFLIISILVLLLLIAIGYSARLPDVGGDSGNWGTVLNDFLGVAFEANGTLRNINNTYNNTTIVTGNLSSTDTIDSTDGFKFPDGSTQIRAVSCFSSLEFSADVNNTSGAIYSNGCWTRKEGAFDGNFRNHSATQTYIYADNITGRMWTTESNNSTRLLNDAFADCDNSTIGGYSDWRLPAFSDAFVASMNGLIQAVSATDEDGDGNISDSATGSISLWTATEYATGSGSTSNQLAWNLINPATGQGDPATDKNGFRCVR